MTFDFAKCIHIYTLRLTQFSKGAVEMHGKYHLNC